MANLASVLKDEIRRLADAVFGEMGPIHILVNNAAVFGRTPFTEATADNT